MNTLEIEEFERMNFTSFHNTVKELISQRNVEKLTALSLSDERFDLKELFGHNILEVEKFYIIAFETQDLATIQWLQNTLPFPLKNMLFAATTSGKLFSVSYTINSYKDMNTLNNDMNHCFKHASYLGHEDIMRYMVNTWSAEIFTPDTIKTAYQHAVSRGHVNIAKWLGTRFCTTVKEFDRKRILTLVPADENSTSQIEWLVKEYNISKEEILSVPVLSKCVKDLKVVNWVAKNFDITEEELKNSLSRIEEYRDKRQKALISGDDVEHDNLFKEYMAIVC